MDVKGSGNISSTNLVGDKEDSIVHYIAIKGSLHAHDCAIFGLKEEETRALESKFTRSLIVNGEAFKTNVMIVLNALVQLGYKIISSTVMDHAQDCDHSNCAGAASSNASVMQTLSEMDWERGIWNAAFNGELNKVQLLIDKARDAKQVVSATDNAGYTALHYAARNGSVEICKLLLQYGADIDAQTKSRATPLHKAAASGKMSTVNFLIRNGASLDAQDIDGETVLHKAIHNKKTELVEIFLQSCPNLRNISDNKGRIPNIV